MNVECSTTRAHAHTKAIEDAPKVKKESSHSGHNNWNWIFFPLLLYWWLRNNSQQHHYYHYRLSSSHITSYMIFGSVFTIAILLLLRSLSSIAAVFLSTFVFASTFASILCLLGIYSNCYYDYWRYCEKCVCMFSIPAAGCINVCNYSIRNKNYHFLSFYVFFFLHISLSP